MARGGHGRGNRELWQRSQSMQIHFDADTLRCRYTSRKPAFQLIPRMCGCRRTRQRLHVWWASSTCPHAGGWDRGESADALRKAELPADDGCIRINIRGALAEHTWYAQPSPAPVSEHLHQAELRARGLGGASPCEPQCTLLCMTITCM